MTDGRQQFQTKRALAIGAHPDDIEFLMAGTLILLGRAGFELHYMNLANGCCGSTEFTRTETSQRRLTEAKSAAAVLNATFHPPLVNDLEVFYDQATLSQLASVLRQVAPDILLVHAPDDYMEDHNNACRLAVSAAFCRGMPNFPVNPPRPPVTRPVAVYHAQPFGNVSPLGKKVRPGIFVDIATVIKQKTEALAKHQSQQQWLDESQGHDSYLETMRQMSRELGTESGVFEYSEGWRRRNHLGFCGPDDNPLLDALADYCQIG